MTQARGVTEALPMKAHHSTQVIYLQQDLNSKDCGESIVKITKYLQEAMHKFKSSRHSGILASSDSESQTLFLKPTVSANRDCLHTMLRAEKLRMGSSAARDTELSIMKTRMRLVKIWWLINLWQNMRKLGQNIDTCQ